MVMWCKMPIVIHEIHVREFRLLGSHCCWLKNLLNCVKRYIYICKKAIYMAVIPHVQLTQWGLLTYEGCVWHIFSQYIYIRCTVNMKWWIPGCLSKPTGGCNECWSQSYSLTLSVIVLTDVNSLDTFSSIKYEKHYMPSTEV